MLNWENFRIVPGHWANRVVSKGNSEPTIGVARAPTPDPSPEGVRTQLERILASSGFARSSRLTRFLRFSVEQVLCGNGEHLKEQTIGIEVFDRKPDYDPRIDPIVRVEARRLRVKLKAYYTSRGRRDEVWIALPKGSYAALFRSRRGAEESHSPKPVPRPEKSPAGTAEKSIAVLPFANLTPEAGDDYFSDGLTEELIHLLTRIPHFRVMAWETTSKLRGREQDFAGVREELEVGSILRGSVRRTEGRVRVRAQLIDAETGAYLWSEAYDRQMQDVFAIQEEIARAIVDTLQLTLQALQFRGGQPPGLKCYNLCLQGRFHANKRTGDGLCKSIACFEQAIAVEETCAVAYAGLADAFSLLADHGFLDPAEATRRARSAAVKALEIDPQCAEAHVSLAFVRSVFEWAWEDAERLYRRAIVLNPGYSRAHHWYGLDHLAMLGRLDEALAEVRLAHSLDPLSQIIREGCGYVHMLRGEYPAALETYRQLVDLDPAFYKGYSSMGRLLSLMGRYDEAVAALEKARSLGGDAPPILSALGQTLARAGRTPEALQLLEELRRMSKTGWVPSACFAILHLGLGDHDTALKYFEAAADARELAVTALKVHPMYAPLRGEPRFQALLSRIGL
jgi:TolB-like protein/Tfp pilus assembly protein PilF